MRLGLWLTPPKTFRQDQQDWKVLDCGPSQIDLLVSQYQTAYPEGDERRAYMERLLRAWWQAREERGG